MALEVTGVGNNTKILQQNKGVEQTEKDIQLFEGCGTGHSDNLDIKRNDYQKKLNEVEKAKIALKGFAPAFETNNDGDIVVKTPGDGTLYVTALENKIKELDKNLKKAEEKSTKLKNELNRYQNTPEFLNRTDDTTYEKKDKEFRDAVDAAEKIKKNIETLQGLLGDDKKPDEGTARARVNELRTALDKAEEDAGKAQKEVKKTRREGKRKANIERKDANKKAVETYNADLQKAEAKKAANKLALEQGVMPEKDEYSEKYAVDAAKKHADLVKAQAYKDVADTDIKVAFPGLESPAFETAKKDMEEKLATYKQKISETQAARTAKNADPTSTEKADAYNAAQQAEATAKEEYDTALALYNDVNSFITTTKDIEVGVDERGNALVINTTYQALLNGVGPAQTAWEKARDAGLAKLDATEATDKENAKTKKDNDIAQNKAYAKDLKQQVRLLTPEVFNHKNKTKEDAVAYGQCVLEEYFPGSASLLRVEAKQEGNAWIPVYKDLNGTVIKNLQQTILNDGKELPRR